MSQVNYFFSPPFIGTNWFPPHSFVPTTVLPSFHDLTSAHKHVLPPIAENFACCFLVQSRPNTIANQQRIVIWHYEGRWNGLVMTCPALRQDIGPFEDLSVLTKICRCPTSRSHLFLRLFDKMYRACNADQS